MRFRSELAHVRAAGLVMIMLCAGWQDLSLAADDCETMFPREIYRSGQSTPAGWSQGDLVFFPAADLPTADELTCEEWYIVAGAAGTSSSARRWSLLDPMAAYSGKKGSLPPWWMPVYFAIEAYYRKYGEIPDVLDAQALSRIAEKVGRNPVRLEMYKSPITGDWPRLKVKDPQPGDLYVRALSTAEKRYFAHLNPTWKSQWFGGTDWALSPETGRVDASGPVFYLWVQGYNGPLIQDLQYSVSGVDQRSGLTAGGSEH